MIELESENHLSDKLEETTEGVATTLGGEPAVDPMVIGDSPQVLGTGQNGPDLPTAEIVLLIRERLEQHPHFQGRNSLLQIELVDETIVLSGCVPSHYLKQILQEAIRLIPDVVDIDNRVSVMRPDEWTSDDRERAK
jgi:hypothetical protein